VDKSWWQAAVKDGMQFLIQDSLEKARLGLTSVSEVLGRAGAKSVEPG
jgi:type II secretory ATPase GspE/PulE/Tfp pilus assembly ATPase PilB-like protein